MGNACQRCRFRSCCQNSEVTNEEALEDTKDQNQPTEYQAHRHRTSLEEARLSNSDSVPKLMQSLIKPGEVKVDLEADGKATIQPRHIRLKVLSSNVLQKHVVVVLTPSGYEHSLRSERDGYVYFGAKKRAKGSGHFKGPVINDFVIPVRDKDKPPGRHFQIRYDSMANAYFARNLGLGLGLFLKLDRVMRLTEPCLIHIGESYLFLMVVPRPPALPRLRLTLYGGVSTGQVLYFEPEDYGVSSLYIGRDQSCGISIEDTLVSKVQTTIRHREGWEVLDGNGDSGRPSTNGTWLYVQEDTELRGNMILKVGQTLFQVAN